MKFEELTEIWNSANIELEKSVQINRELVKQLGLKKIKSNLFEIKWTAIFEIITQFIFTVFIMGFIINHLSELQFLIPAAILFVFSLFSMIVEIIKLKLFVTIDSSATVVESQKKLTGLKYFEKLDINSLYIIIPFFSAPFLIVFAKAFLNLNLYDYDWITYGIYSVFVGFIVAIIIVYFLNKSGVKKLDDSIYFLNELK